MKNKIALSILLVSCCWFLSAGIYTFMAYYITEQQGGFYVDGFGRELSNAPMTFKLLSQGKSLWPGPGQCLLDMVVIWGSIIGAGYLAKFAINKFEKDDDEDGLQADEERIATKVRRSQ